MDWRSPATKKYIATSSTYVFAVLFGLARQLSSMTHPMAGRFVAARNLHDQFAGARRPARGASAGLVFFTGFGSRSKYVSMVASGLIGGQSSAAIRGAHIDYNAL
jgi:hypothetical protein